MEKPTMTRLRDSLTDLQQSIILLIADKAAAKSLYDQVTEVGIGIRQNSNVPATDEEIAALKQELDVVFVEAWQKR